MRQVYEKKKKAKRKRPKSPLEIAKQRAWKVYSQWIRRSVADKDGNVVCVTCSIKKHWKDMQSGHWLDGRGNAILFEESCANPQCLQCNFFGGKPTINVKENYRAFMMKEYGEEEMERLRGLKGTAKKYELEDYISIEEEYGDRLVGLDMRDGKI